MNRVFVDTSAVIALLVATDEFHQAAKSAFAGLAARETPLLTTSYVLVETYALLGRRLGIDAVRGFREHFTPLLEVVWVNRDLHEQALDLLLQRAYRTLSLVDVTSFLVIQDQKIEEVFAFDRHFSNEGFRFVR
jgi:predicted nucleic acid-binding protein